VFFVLLFGLVGFLVLWFGGGLLGVGVFFWWVVFWRFWGV